MTLQAKQTAQQRFVLAPNITLALKVLRMPTMELQTYLRQQVEENPLLEVDDFPEEDSATPPAEANGKEDSPAAGLDEEWLSHWENSGAEEDPNDDQEGENRALEQRLAKPESFHESLRLQLGCQRLPEEGRRLGAALIDHLDESGYLEGSLEELAEELGAPLDRLEEVLKVIQRFDPPGVGARDLRECLMIQLEQRGSCGSLPATQQDLSAGASQLPAGPADLAYRILKDHFKLFIQHNLSALAKATGSSLWQVEEAYECLKRLDPKPGRIFSGDLSPSIVPDLIIVRREKHDDVELHDQAMPHLTVSRAYYRMLKDPNTPADAKEFLANKFRNAGWLIKAIDERNATLLSIGRCLISLQRDFVEHGPRAIRPLTQAQVADFIGRHASTVSRAICGKTIDTPYGVFRLEQLFASNVPQPAETDGVSDKTIKSEVQRLIEEEDPHRSLSDAALAKLLAQRNISVARRTIAKYRTSLRILPAHLRKRRF